MSRLGPVITLAAGAVLFAGLGVASVTATPVAQETAAAASTAPTTSAATEPPPPTETATAKPTPVRADYATRVKGGLLAISVRNGKAIAYFCDGRTEAWFKGEAADGAVELEGFGEANVTAALGGGKAAGELALGGKTWDFSAPLVKKPSGLYRATAVVRGAQVKAGWIMLRRPDGNGFYQVGMAAEGEKKSPAPTLDTTRPNAPVRLGDTTLYPQDIEEIS
ncbi:hypothetical protein [Nonomuraea endophytica]|uniref:Serine/threonine protein kinase n=1 Tax=Nonomuraea endophytica TaxID=714136 RepID=A0A7W8A7F9_9ACTN|nr:hypothetical protein [Nonomuraea endophytica]MBB5081002.1 hypothetical protein [Nonomuraea endophytica]